ncbi:MAG: RHS repeat-associated core domain-containing protein, partial [Fulvivirga sp.]
AKGLKNYTFLAGERLVDFGFKSKKRICDYEYFLKDHLGNNRVVFTTKPKTHEFTLNYESDTNLPDDESMFDNLDNIIPANIHDHTDAGSTYDKSQLLNGANGGVIGSVVTIPVGAGDKISAEVWAKYLAPTGTSNPTAAVGSLLIAALTGNTGTLNYEGSINSSYGTSGSMATGVFGDEVSSTEPMAFINLLFLPDDVAGTIENSHFAFSQISSASSNSHAILALDEPYEAPESGYIVVYLSNESTNLTEVYFDDLKVTVEEHPVIQKTDFYPFGMAHAGGYQRITAKENRYLFGGKELQTDLGLGWLDYHARQYDPALGRFTTIDPLTEAVPDWTPYRYGLNNPLRFNDPTGLLEVDKNGESVTYETEEEIGLFIAGLNKQMGNKQGEKSDQQNETQQEDGEKIDLASSKSGEQLVESLKSYVEYRKDNKKAGVRSQPVYLEDIIDVNSQLSGNLGYGPVTNSTKGSKDIFGTRVEITIWLRKNLKGEYLKKDASNQFRGFKLNKGRTNAVSGNLESSILLRNNSDEGAIIRLQVYNNPEYAQKLYDHIMGRTPITTGTDK